MPVFHHPRRVVIDEGGETQPAKALIPIAAILIGAGILGLIETLLGWLEVALGVLGNVPVPLVLLLPGALAFTAAGFIIGRRATLTIHPAPPLGGPIQAQVIAVGPQRRRALSQGRTPLPTSTNTAETVPAIGPVDRASRRQRGAQ